MPSEEKSASGGHKLRGHAEPAQRLRERRDVHQPDHQGEVRVRKRRRHFGQDAHGQLGHHQEHDGQAQVACSGREAGGCAAVSFLGSRGSGRLPQLRHPQGGRRPGRVRGPLRFQLEEQDHKGRGPGEDLRGRACGCEPDGHQRLLSQRRSPARDGEPHDPAVVQPQ